MRSLALREAGFTLIEIVIVILIISILAALALPAYQEQVRRSRRAAATGVLLEVVQCAERFHTSNRTYVGSEPICLVPAVRNTDFYNFAFVPAGMRAQTFQIQATPVGVQAVDRCGILQINQADQRRYSGTGPDDECRWGTQGLLPP